MTDTLSNPLPYDFLLCRHADKNDYGLYRIDLTSEALFVPMPLAPNAAYDSGYRMAQVGGYVLQWSPMTTLQGVEGYHYRLLNVDVQSNDPLNDEALQTGFWPKKKFWGYRAYYSDNPDEGKELNLTPMASFVLNTIPAAGRGTYELWNFDPQPLAPGSADPLPESAYSTQGGFPLIKAGHELLSLNNYVLDRQPDGSGYRVWSFDPQQHPPLSLPAVQTGRWDHITREHGLVAIGECVLDWHPESGCYRLWQFDPQSPGALLGPLREGRLPEGMCGDVTLMALQPRRPAPTVTSTPGGLDYMRSRIKHVVYYMLESRSFDNICGWLYQKGEEGCHYIGSHEPFDGASEEDFNLDGDKPVYVSQFMDGKLSDQWDLIAVNEDPFHDTTDALQQMFLDGEGYWARKTPDMKGFILNTANPQVMQTFSPTQLPIMNGLARNFAVSDRWFSSIPGGTDVNRAFSVTGSAFNRLGTWEGGDVYKYWPYSAHRQSLWKVLWSQGITDWKIYNSIQWEECVFTYQLYLKGQIPSVDNDTSRFLADIDQFKQDALNGNLPAFSYLEPSWIAPSGATSYHPGTDLVPGEVALNDIYEAIKNGPGWEETLLVITFDKNNGLYDHVSPPYATKPWPNDLNDGFAYDLMGARVPTLMVSPWIKPQSVIRAAGAVPFDSTSFAATLLQWFGVPKAQWGLGDRLDQAPTFEAVLQSDIATRDAPTLTPPYDKSHPRVTAKD